MPVLPVRETEFENRLNAYCATLRTSPLVDALKRSMGSWQNYATVTGAALAMASNASASIIYSGIINATATVSSAPFNGPSVHGYQSVPFKNATGGLRSGFQLGLVQRSVSSFQGGLAGVRPRAYMSFLTQSSRVKRLSSHARISGGNLGTGSAFKSGFFPIAQRTHTTSGITSTGQFPPQGGLAGFRFTTYVNGSQQTDYGWVRLQYTTGTNGFINSITAVDWAYQSDGTAILAGDTGSAPEPSTTALMLLAAGAAGVEALRRRRAKTQ